MRGFDDLRRLRDGDQPVERRIGRARIDRLRGDRGAFAEVGGAAGDDERRRGIEDRDVAIRAAHAPEHAPERRRIVLGVAAAQVLRLGARQARLLGPLSNPASVRRQMVGVFAREWVEPLARVLLDLGSEHAWVVHGSDGLDEITTTGPTTVAEARDGEVRVFEVTPDDAGLPRAQTQDLRGGDAAHNATALRSVLRGVRGPGRGL